MERKGKKRIGKDDKRPKTKDQRQKTKDKNRIRYTRMLTFLPFWASDRDEDEGGNFDMIDPVPTAEADGGIFSLFLFGGTAFRLSGFLRYSGSRRTQPRHVI